MPKKSLTLTLVLTMLMGSPSPAVAAAPANDDMASPTAVSGNSFTEIVDVMDSTLEGGEPTPSCEYGTPDGSVWYTFSPAGNGTLELHASGGFAASSFVMAVYETSPAGTQLECHAESSPDIELAFTSGTTYYIQVRGAVNDGFSTLTLEGSVYGTVTGTVVDAGASPLQNISVTAWERIGTQYGFLGSDVTDASGDYDISIPPSDTVVIQFVGGATGYENEWYDDQPFREDALDIDVDAAATVANIDAVLKGDSTLTVTVKDLLGNPIESAWVKLYAPSGTYLFGGTTNASGVKAFTGLKAATYHIQYSKSGWVTEWHDEAADQGSSTGVVIGANVDIVMDEALVADGNDPFIGATTIGSLPFAGSASMQGVGMDVDEPEPTCKYILADGSRWWSYTPAGNERLSIMLTGTDSTQRVAVYTGASLGSLTEVACGNRLDSFDAVSGTTYWIQAHGRTVSSGNEVEFTLAKAGTASVTLIDAGTAGGVLVGHEACIYRSSTSDTEVACGTSDGSGHVGFEVPAGTYRLRGVFGHDEGSVVSWYDGAASHGSATDVVVTAGGTTPIEFAIDTPARISGTVTDRVGDPVEATVKLYDAGGSVYATTASDAGGAYSFEWSSGVVAGTWYLEACPAGETCTLYGDTLSGGDPTAGTPIVTTLNQEVAADIVVQTGALPFGDTATHQFKDEIGWLSSQGITGGCSTDPLLFCPDATVTRGQMASFLARALGLPDSSKDWFTDDDGSTHEANINKLADAGITLGFAGGIYKPNDPVRRDHMASFLARALGLPESIADWFTDDDGSTHEQNINRLADSGITLGCSGSDPTVFCPAKLVTRGQMAAFLFRGLAP